MGRIQFCPIFLSGGEEMPRRDTFTFRVNVDERQLIAALADRLQRSQSDAVRWLIREAAHELLDKPNIPDAGQEAKGVEVAR
jgi:uncharacterized protein (DUF1778 family)